MTLLDDADRRRAPAITLSPEGERYGFWQPHATPIQASLLRLTGWLDEDPEREVLVVDNAEGRSFRATAAGTVSPSQRVLFRIEKPGTRERADFETYFVIVRKLQSAERLKHQMYAKAQAKLAEVDARIVALRKEKDRIADAETASRAELMAKARRLARAAKAGIARGSKPSPNGPYTKLLKLREEAIKDRERRLAVARGIAGRFEALRYERSPFEQELRLYDPKKPPQIYVGLFAQINAFLDVQALSAASIAIEEFRKTPRHESAVVEEMERRLATD